MAMERSAKPSDAEESKEVEQKPKLSLVESLKQKLQTKRQKLKKEDPNIYPMW